MTPGEPPAHVPSPAVEARARCGQPIRNVPAPADATRCRECLALWEGRN
jgi:hypothetical protein